jgi:type II secretory pathway component PulF
MLLMAGQESGKLAEAMQSIIKLQDAKITIRQTILAGLSYPLILLMGFFGILVLFGYVVVPQFLSMVPDGFQWHGMASLVVSISTLAQIVLPYLGAFLLVSVVVFIHSLTRWRGHARTLADRYPPYSVYRLVAGASFLISLSELVNAGVRMEDALERLKRHASPWLRVRVQAALSGLREGVKFGDALDASGYEFPDREVIDDLGVFSGLSGFHQALKTVAEEWLSESLHKVKSTMGLVFKVGIILLGVLFGILLFGSFSMVEQFQSGLSVSF